MTFDIIDKFGDGKREIWICEKEEMLKGGWPRRKRDHSFFDRR